MRPRRSINLLKNHGNPYCPDLSCKEQVQAARAGVLLREARRSWVSGLTLSLLPVLCVNSLLCIWPQLCGFPPTPLYLHFLLRQEGQDR